MAQTYIFRLNKETIRALAVMGDQLGDSYWSSVYRTYAKKESTTAGNEAYRKIAVHSINRNDTNSIIGVHVRLGDKATDGFKPVDSLETYYNAIEFSLQYVYEIGSKCVEGTCTDTVGAHGMREIINKMQMNKILCNQLTVVVSDDNNVLAEAQSAGMKTGIINGKNQQYGVQGIDKTLSDPSTKNRLDYLLEIVYDVSSLCRAKIIIGSISSQIFRMAVGISNATALLAAGILIDPENMGQTKYLSEYYSVYFPEENWIEYKQSTTASLTTIEGVEISLETSGRNRKGNNRRRKNKKRKGKRINKLNSELRL